MFVDGGSGNTTHKVSLKDFKEWTKDQTGEYTFVSSDDCAFAQYLKARGHTNVLVGSSDYDMDGRINIPLSFTVNRALFSRPRTFEALYDRL